MFYQHHNFRVTGINAFKLEVVEVEACTHVFTMINLHGPL
jgi:hypothetical protein